MRIVVLFAFVVLALGSSAGCTPVRYEGSVAHGTFGSGMPAPEDDAGTPPGDAAHLPPSQDGGHVTAPVDAWVRPGTDAWVAPQPDAWVAPPDAYVMPACPSYAGTVRAIYAMHCGSCHTTGTSPHFGSSYTVASQSTSSCGGSMASCTIQLGQPGGSMSYRDPYGGFSTAELASIQSWIGCGLPR